MSLKYYFDEVHPKIRDALNISSLCFAGIVLVTIAMIAYRGFRLVNRATFLIQAGIAIRDIIHHSALILMFEENLNDFVCQFIPFSSHFGTSFYILLNVAVALNLHLTILLNMRPDPKWQKYYWVGAIIFALIVNVIPLGLGVFGKTQNYCWFDVNYTQTPFMALTMTIIPNTLGMTYCLAVTGVLIYKLHYTAEKVVKERPSGNTNDPFENAILLQEVRYIVYRVALYPIAFFLSLGGFTLYQFYVMFDTTWSAPRTVLAIISSFTLRSAGLLNMLAYFMDPSFNTGIFLVFKPRDYKFDQPYKLDQLNSNPTHELNINRNVELQNEDPISRLVFFRKKDRHLGPMDIEEFKSLL